jgi:hypothetical protein
MTSLNRTDAGDLAYAARVCKCVNCKRLANRAEAGLQATLTFTHAFEALNNTPVLRLCADDLCDQ